MSKKVAVIMGSDSDFPTVSAAVKKLKSFGVPVEVHVMSAHRTPHDAAEFSEHAKENGFGVIIAAAGKAAHRFRRVRPPGAGGPPARPRGPGPLGGATAHHRQI